uniref:glutathione transferase n=1 Tax=Culicoides sonorensis TaxID=179676 RepID=A0A336LA08_CULSO
MAPVKLYYYYRSPPSRAVLLLIKYLEIEHEIIEVDLFKGQHMEDWFLEINPRHQVPVLDDNGFIITESKAILCYLANSRMPGSSLYSLTPKKRAIVDSRLYFDATTVFARVLATVKSVVFEDATEVSEKVKDDILDVLNYCNGILKESTWIAGDELSIADFAIVSTLAALFFMGINIEDYPEINRWYEQCKGLPGFDENETGAKALADVVNEKVDTETAF